MFQLGSISTGTLRIEDLLPAFYEAMTEDSINSIDKIEFAYQALDGEYWETEDPQCDLDAMIDALQEQCPPFVYFGAHPGDGSDFGFWPDWDVLNEALCLILDRKAVDGSTEICLDDCIIVSHANDTVTVMDMDRNVIWSVV